MSKEVILKIKQTEAEAEKIRSDASDRAKEKLRNAEVLGMALCEKAENDAVRENAEKLRLTREKAEELLERSRQEAQKEKDRLRAQGAPYMGDAVRLIIGGIFEKCQ